MGRQAKRDPLGSDMSPRPSRAGARQDVNLAGEVFLRHRGNLVNRGENGPSLLTMLRTVNTAYTGEEGAKTGVLALKSAC
jgi:hypothetical protein